MAKYLGCLAAVWLGGCSLVFTGAESSSQGACQEVLSLGSGDDDGEIATFGNTLEWLPDGEVGDNLDSLFVGYWDGTKASG